MVDFKSLITENETTRKFINSVIKKDYYGVPVQKRLYRGTYDSVNSYEIRSVSDDRTPIDTDLSIDSIVEQVRKNYYSDFPSRQKSLFVSGKESVAKAYGDVHYVFVPKTSKIVWSQADAFRDFFMEADRKLHFLSKLNDQNKSLLKKLHNELEKTNLEPFLDFLNSCGSDCSNVKTAKIFARNYRSFLSYNYDRNLDALAPGVYDLVQYIKGFTKIIKKYFESYEHYKGEVNHRNVTEMIIETDHFVLADKNWFHQNIEPKI